MVVEEFHNLGPLSAAVGWEVDEDAAVSVSRGTHTPEPEGELDEDGVTKVKVGGDQLTRTALQRETTTLKMCAFACKIIFFLF